MFVKVIGILLFCGFFYVQLGSSLECWSCTLPQNCNNPIKNTCNYVNANETTNHLHKYFNENLTSLTSNTFDCFFHNYTSAPLNVTYKGCIYRNIPGCDLTLKPAFGQLRRTGCLKCSGNLCNSNPAGTFSSSITTMSVSILAIFVYKVLKA